MKIAIFGSGYVGLVSGVCLAELGNEVTFVDIDSNKLDSIQRGTPPIYEEGLEELLKKNLTRIHTSIAAQYDSSDAEAIFICVGTPPNPDGTPNYKFIRTVTAQIGESIKKTPHNVTIIVKSTVLPGTTEEIIRPILEEHSEKKVGRELGLAMNPEFLKEGLAVHDFMNPDRIIVGSIDEYSREILTRIYAPFSCKKLHTTPKVAEMIKYVSNAFLATKISFANEIGNICKQNGIDTEEVFTGVGMDARINPAFFVSGIGFGGSCFPKDVQALISHATNQGLTPKLLPAVLSINDEQPLRLISILKKYIPNLHGKRIGILGLSFKPCSDDIRESRVIPILESLLEEGADIMAYDPLATEQMKHFFPGITYMKSAESVLNTEAVIIATAHPEFEHLNYEGKVVIDGRRVRAASKEAAIYEGVCW
ncbi:MAG: UDP-glucose/GDP-mannose dehydrogenase family protein [Methanomicrobiales archaeon]|nr:UDP-glucose/GDP-mannose dehydrogenase family protein [Methanomicrobiales archaeon]